jgi:signal peptidase I
MHTDELNNYLPDPDNNKTEEPPPAEHTEDIMTFVSEDAASAPQIICEGMDMADYLAGRDLPSRSGCKQTLKAIIREAVIILLLFSVLLLGMKITLQNSVIISGSMEPTLGVKERILVYKLAYKFGHEPQRGDIIVFTPPEQIHSDMDYIKRIIGLPGEIVEIKDGVVSIHKPDGSTIILDEPYIAAPTKYYYISPEPIPADNYFVMGDNRNNSADSRGGWTVPRNNIVGRAFWAFWPFSKFGAAPNYSLPK